MKDQNNSTPKTIQTKGELNTFLSFIFESCIQQRSKIIPAIFKFLKQTGFIQDLDETEFRKQLEIVINIKTIEEIEKKDFTGELTRNNYEVFNICLRIGEACFENKFKPESIMPKQNIDFALLRGQIQGLLQNRERRHGITEVAKFLKKELYPDAQEADLENEIIFHIGLGKTEFGAAFFLTQLIENGQFRKNVESSKKYRYYLTTDYIIKVDMTKHMPVIYQQHGVKLKADEIRAKEGLFQILNTTVEIGGSYIAIESDNEHLRFKI